MLWSCAMLQLLRQVASASCDRPFSEVPSIMTPWFQVAAVCPLFNCSLRLAHPIFLFPQAASSRRRPGDQHQQQGRQQASTQQPRRQRQRNTSSVHGQEEEEEDEQVGGVF